MFLAVHDARRAGVAVPVDVVAARVGPVVAAEPGGVQERVDDGSVVAGHNPAVRPRARREQIGLHVRTARRVVAEDHRGARGYRPLLS
jgi:hypothetical protein